MMTRPQLLHERELKRQAVRVAEGLARLEGADARAVLQYAIDLVGWLDSIEAKKVEHVDFPRRAQP